MHHGSRRTRCVRRPARDAAWSAAHPEVHHPAGCQRPCRAAADGGCVGRGYWHPQALGRSRIPHQPLRCRRRQSHRPVLLAAGSRRARPRCARRSDRFRSMTVAEPDPEPTVPVQNRQQPRLARRLSPRPTHGERALRCSDDEADNPRLVPAACLVRDYARVVYGGCSWRLLVPGRAGSPGPPRTAAWRRVDLDVLVQLRGDARNWHLDHLRWRDHVRDREVRRVGAFAGCGHLGAAASGRACLPGAVRQRALLRSVRPRARPLLRARGRPRHPVLQRTDNGWCHRVGKVTGPGTPHARPRPHPRLPARPGTR